jgi:MFS transporter, SHS family, lactate transporter
MSFLRRLQSLTSVQRNTFIACFLGWSLDAFDFFILVFCVTAISADFHTKVSAIAEAIFITLAMRPVGAFLFGMMADKFGRRPTLMIDIIAYSIFELGSALAPSLHVFLIMRALFGIAMGGEWGVGAALAFETLPKEGRGFFSGLLQEGYVVGYLLAALVYGTLFSYVGWRGMFVIGALPAFLVIYIRTKVDESPAFLEGQTRVKEKRQLSRDVLMFGGSFLFLIDVRFQLIQPRQTGPVSHIPAKESWLHAQNSRIYCHRLQHWRAAGRCDLWLVVRKDWPPQGHCHRRAMRHSVYSFVGIRK